MAAATVHQLIDAFADQFAELNNPLLQACSDDNDARLQKFKESKGGIKLPFGEFRLICIAHVQTQILLWRATAWQLHELLGFEREEQLPYFTIVPGSQVDEALSRQLDDIVQFGFDADNDLISSIKTKIKSVLDAETCLKLLENVTELGNLFAKGWHNLIANAKTAHNQFLERQVLLSALQRLSAKVAGKPVPDLDTIVTNIKDQYEKAGTDLASAFRNPRLTSNSKISWFLFLPNDSEVHVPVGNSTINYTPNFVELKWIEDELLGPGSTFLQCASKVAEKYREEPQAHSTHDRLAFHTAYYLLGQGQNEFNRYGSRFLGTVGFRKLNHQTCLSLTDPGQGHVFGTTTQKGWMEGVIVHVEHLERPARSGRDAIESYRMPSVLEFARVRLHTGSAAPNTCYVGRPLQDSNQFKWDFIKVVDTISSACTSMFNLGGAECKIAMSRMKASEMVAYMRALSAHTLRNHRQYLSAAFNLNTPLSDDIDNNHFEDKMRIGHRAIELAALGGFEKVTWDGASDIYPSVPLLEANPRDNRQLSLVQAIKLVHYAHSVGLATYFSAGFKADHIETVVYSGVDGVGIGGAQVIRGMDRASGMHGEYQESRIKDLIDKRDEAALRPRGRAAKLLARLDQMFFEGSLNPEELSVRSRLFKLICATPPDEAAIVTLLADDDVKATWRIDSDDPLNQENPQENGDGESPWNGRASRLIKERGSRKPLLYLHGGKPVVEESEDAPGNKPAVHSTPALDTDWNKFIASLKHNIYDEGILHALYMSDPWKKMRSNYQAWVRRTYTDLPRYFMGEVVMPLKVTPYGDPASRQVNDI